MVSTMVKCRVGEVTFMDNLNVVIFVGFFVAFAIFITIYLILFFVKRKEQKTESIDKNSEIERNGNHYGRNH